MRGKIAWMACLLCLLPLLARAADPALARRLAEAERLLTRAETHPEQRAARVREALALVPADSCPTLREAAGTVDRPTLARARREVQALRQVARLSARSAIPAADARKALGTVLARNEFQSLRRTKTPAALTGAQKWLHDVGAWIKAKWNAFWQWVGDGLNRFGRWLDKLFKPLRINPQPARPSPIPTMMPSGMKTLLLVLLGVAILFILGFIASHLLAAARRRAAVEQVRDDDGLPVATRKQEPTFWERSLQQAQSCWDAGDERAALRHLTRACLVLLDVRGMLRYDDARANGEVLRELRRQGRGPVTESLRPVVRCFDRSWYGFLPVSTEEFTSVLEHTRQFRETVVGDSR
jgi:hypothetical protein